jgi:chaperone modulatory protein CbpM
MSKSIQTLSGIVLDEDLEFSLAELCRACSIHAERLIELVDEGILEPTGHSQREWRFSAPQLLRVRTVIHLQRDLGINLAGAALALQLLDEIDRLHGRLQGRE